MSESTINAYNQRARKYERRWKAYLSHTHQVFLDRVSTTAGDHILDASGGTGLLVQRLIESGNPFARMVVSDPSTSMLNIARNRLADQEGVEFCNHRVQELPYGEDSFDKVFCLNAFHFYPDQADILERFHRIIKPGGTLYILDWNREGFFHIVNRIIDWSTSEYIDTRSLPELERMLAGEGFGIDDTTRWSWWYWKFLYVEASCRS